MSYGSMQASSGFDFVSIAVAEPEQPRGRVDMLRSFSAGSGLFGARRPAADTPPAFIRTNAPRLVRAHSTGGLGASRPEITFEDDPEVAIARRLTAMGFDLEQICKRLRLLRTIFFFLIS